MWFLNRKPLSSILQPSNSSGAPKLTYLDLIVTGIGAMVGCGVFVLTGIVAAQGAGPGVILSYLIAGVATVLIALPYAELAASLPSSGSIYSYTQVIFGELFSFIVLGILMLEFVCGTACTASAAGAYFMTFVEQNFGLTISSDYLKTPLEGGILNLPAVFTAILFGALSIIGSEGRSFLSNLLVLLKILTIIFFVTLAVPYFDGSNLDPFAPFGFGKIIAGSAVLFAAFSGFSVIPTLADSCKNPARDIVLGILGSVLLTIAIYVCVAVFAVGIAPYSELGNPEALISVLWKKGAYLGTKILSWGVMLSIVAVLMILIQATARIFLIVSKDGLLPNFFQSTKYSSGKPIYGIVFCTLCAAILGGLVKYRVLAEMASIGALGDYIVAMILVVIFRRRYPLLERKFKCPFLGAFASAATIGSLYLLYKQVSESDTPAFGICICWVLGFIGFYFLYSALRYKGQNS